MNDEVKHTPIPARIDPRASTHIVGANGRHIASTGGYSSNLPEDRDTYSDESEANAAFIVEAVNNYDRLREVNADLLAALERYMTYCETFGEEQLRAEFGPPEHEGSSWAMEAWLDRVLRDPARAAIARARGEAGVKP